jgi:hypothetical protein
MTMLQPALLGSLERTTENTRAATRRQVKLKVDCAASADATTVLIHNISATGLLIECEAALEAGEQIAVDLPRTGQRQAKVVWASLPLYGCEFEAPIGSGSVSAAALRSAWVREDEPRSAPEVPEPSADHQRSESTLSIGARMRIILGLALSCWLVIAVAATVLMR